MNFKKLKRMLSIVLSATMILSSNMTGLATEVSAPDQENWQLDTELAGATTEDAGIDRYVSDNGDVRYEASALADEVGNDGTSDSQTPEDTNTPAEEPIAQIGTTTYTSLPEAFAALAAAPADSILELKGNAVLDGTATYNLAGKTVQTAGYMITIASGAKIRLQGGTFENTVLAAPGDNGAFSTLEGNHVMINAEPGSILTIEGNGTYKTKAVQMLRIKGDVTIANGTFECTATKEEVANKNNYNGAVMFSVAESTGKLTMLGGTVTAKAGNESNEGMYGIFAYSDSTVVLGQKTTNEDGTETEAGPTVESQSAAIGLSDEVPNATLTINGGTYKSGVGTAENIEGFNTVLYLATDSMVTINGGTFEAGVAAANVHVISFSGNAAQTIRINDGTFTSTGDVFYQLSSETNQSKVEVRGGKFSTAPTNYVASGYTVNGTSAPYTVGLLCRHNGTHSEGQETVNDLQPVAAINPTCFKEGQIFHYHCSNCGKNFAYLDAEQKPQRELTDDELKSVDKKNHDGVWVEPQEKTCKDYGIKGHYKCENCGYLYLTMDDLMNDSDENPTRKTLTELQDTEGGKLDHTYDVTDTENPYTFTWNCNTDEDSDDVKTFENLAALMRFDASLTGDDVNVTSIVSVSRKCTVCGEADTNYQPTITITKTPAAAPTSYDCTEGVTVTYTATAEKAGSDGETESGGSAPQSTFTAQIAALDQHDYEYTATLDKPDPAAAQADPIDFRPGTDSFTVTRSCRNTDCSKAEAEEAESVKVYMVADDGTKAELTSTCATVSNATLEVEGTFEDGTTGSANVTANVIGTGHSEWVYYSYVAATCEKSGRVAHYECGVCHELFQAPVNTAPTDRLNPEDVVIAQIPHNFSIPQYDWQDSTKTTAKATFTCIKCGASITKTDLQVGEGKEPADKTYTCTEEMLLSYPVTVSFNKEYVKPNGTDSYGDPVYKYEPPTDPDEVFESEYTGEVKKTGVRGHSFVASVAWNDELGEDASHNMKDNGIKVTLTCTNNGCQNTVILPATAVFTKNEDNKTEGTTTTGTLDGTLSSVAAGTVEITKNENYADGFIKAFCTSEGTDVFDISVTCTTNDGKPAKTYTTMMKDGKEVPLRISTGTPAKGHDFRISDEPAGTTETAGYNNVYWENPNADAYPDRAEDVTVILVCENDPRHSVTLTGEDENVHLGTMNDTDDNDNPHQVRTCKKNGVNAWAVSVEYDGKTFEYFNEPGVPLEAGNVETTAEPGDTEEPSEPAPEKIYVTKTLPARGHSYGEGSWDRTSYTTDGSIYYKYTCQNPECIGEEGELSGTNSIDPDTSNAVSYGKENNKTVRKLKASIDTKANPEPTCTENGLGTVTATARLNGESIQPLTFTDTIPSNGHTWDNTSIDWGAWEPVENAEPVEITLNGNTVSVPDYQITVTRTCENCDETESYTGKLSESLTDEDNTAISGAGFVNIKVTAHQDKTCTADGYTVYEAEFYGRANSKDTTAPVKVENTAPNPKRAEDKTTGHVFGTEVKVAWNDGDGIEEEYLKDEDGEPILSANGRRLYTGTFTVDAYRECTVDGCNGTEDVPVTVTQSGSCVNEDGTPGTLTFTANLAEGSEDGLDFAKDNETYRVTYDRHNVTRITGTPSTDCTKPSYGTHYHCSQCGKNFETSAASNEIEISFEAQGHSYGRPVFSLTNNGASALATFSCVRCDEGEVTRQATVGEAFVDVDPKCAEWIAEHPGEDANGYTYYPLYVEYEGTRYEEEYEVIVPSGAHTIDAATGNCKYCGKAFVEVIFRASNGDELSSTYYEKDAASIAIPNAPSRTGYVFTGWQLGNASYPADEIEEAIKTALQAAGTTIEITPLYTASDATATITVKNMIGTEVQEGGSTQQAAVGQYCTLTAEPEMDTYTFSHWSDDEAGNNVLSKDTSYRLYITTASEKTIYAVYRTDAIEQDVPTVVMSDVYGSEAGGAYKLSFATAINLPDGVELIDSGFVYGTKQTAFSSLSDAEIYRTLVVGSENPNVKTKTVTANATSILTVNLGTNGPDAPVNNCNKTIWAKGYVRYTDGNGNVKIDYTGLVKSSYNNPDKTEFVPAADERR